MPSDEEQAPNERKPDACNLTDQVVGKKPEPGECEAAPQEPGAARATPSARGTERDGGEERSRDRVPCVVQRMRPVQGQGH